MLTYLLIQWRHIVTMSHNTFHSSRVIDKRQRRRLANVDIQLRHLVTIRSPNSFHSGHLAITVTLRGPDGDSYGQVLLYRYSIIVIFISRMYNTCSLTSHCIVGPSITVFGMRSKRRRVLFNTNHNSISGTSKCHNVHNEEDTLRETSRTKYPVALSQNRLISFQGHSLLYHY